MMALLILAQYNIDVDESVDDRDALLAQRRRRSIIAWTMGVAAVAGRLEMTFALNPTLYWAGSVLWLVLFAYITLSDLRAVLKRKQVTGKVISMAISTYLIDWLRLWTLLHLLHESAAERFQFRRNECHFRPAGIPGSCLPQPDYAFDDRLRRHNSDDFAGSLHGYRRGHNRPVLSRDPDRTAGRIAYGSIS